MNPPPPAQAPGPLSDFLGWCRALMHQILFLPETASPMARQVDNLQYVEFAYFWFIGMVVICLTAWFCVRYRYRSGDSRPTRLVHAPLWLECGLVVVLLGPFITFWAVGFKQYIALTTAPAGAMDVYVEAKQWMWKFSYPEGPMSAGILYVPRGRPVRVVLSSRDVIHSFFIPEFRIKQDAVPGRYTSTWFQADRLGRFRILCAELCGAGHSKMWADVVVLSPQDFADWLRTAAPPATTGVRGAEGGLASRGLQVAADKGCLRCHTTDGTPHIGPTWLGLWHSSVHLENGRTVVADGAYLTRSMMDPLADMVAGFAPVMPTYQGQISPEETAALVELIRSLRYESAGSAPPDAGVSVPPKDVRSVGERK